MASKSGRKRSAEEEDDMEAKKGRYEAEPSKSRMGRVRKKTSKVLEMEEGEHDLEEAMRPISDSKRARKKSTKVIENEQSEIMKVMKSQSFKKIKSPKMGQVEDSIGLSGYDVAAASDSWASSQLQPPHFEEYPEKIDTKKILAKKDKTVSMAPALLEMDASDDDDDYGDDDEDEDDDGDEEDGEEEEDEQDVGLKLKLLLSPNKDVASVLSPTKEKTLLGSPVKDKTAGPPALLSMMAGHTPQETALVKTEKSRKKKKKEADPEISAAVPPSPTTSQLAQALLQLPKGPPLTPPPLTPPPLTPPPPILEREVPFPEEDGHLVIDTHKDITKKKKPKKEKTEKKASSKSKSPKATPGGTVKSPTASDRGADMTESMSEGEVAGSPPGAAVAAPVYANTEQMAMKLMTSREKKASKEKKGKKSKKEDPEKPKKKRAPTAYMLWCNSKRQQVVEDNPGIDFASISKRLGEIWHGIPEKEKMAWKRKAKKAAAKGSTLISTGKAGTKSTTPAPPASTLLKPVSAPSASTKTPALSSTPTAIPPALSASVQKVTEAVSPYKAAGSSALDVAAHLKLLGESLSIIGARLQEHQGQIAVQGSLSVLLDSMLCALGPLACLTTLVPEMNGCPMSTHSDTLNNVAYFMPGIG